MADPPDDLEREVNRRIPPPKSGDYDYLDYDEKPPDALTQATRTLARAITMDTRVRNYWGKRFYDLAKVVVAILGASLAGGNALVPRLLCIVANVCPPPAEVKPVEPSEPPRREP